MIFSDSTLIEVENMTKYSFKLFAKKSSELPASRFAKHPCNMSSEHKTTLVLKKYKKDVFFFEQTDDLTKIWQISTDCHFLRKLKKISDNLWKTTVYLP